MGLADGAAALGALGRSARDVARVFRADATEGEVLAAAARRAAMDQMRAEFAGGAGRFDRVVDALNRLPRPCLAFGTLGLFVYAMTDPLGFAARMEGLAVVPQPLWWLLGAIVGFYFGARELHYRRGPAPVARPAPRHSAWHADDDAAAPRAGSAGAGANPAVSAWRAARETEG